MHQMIYKVSLFASLFFVACSSNKTDETPAEAAKETHDPEVVEFTPEQYKTANVQLGNVQSINLSNYIKASGTIDAPPQQTVSITSPYGGRILSTTVLEGKYISKGQVVATLENPEFIQMQQDYMESSSQLSFLNQELQRQEELVRENIAAAKSLQRARSEYNTMVARVEGLKSRLRLVGINPARVRAGGFTSRVNIYSPINGFVTQVLSNVGMFVGANEVLANIVNISDLHAEVRIFEKDVPKIKVGQQIRFRTTGDSIERLASVYLIGRDIDSERTVAIHGHLKTSPTNLVPGMFISAVIETGAAATPAVPAEAIVQAGDKNYIFILEEDGQAKPKEKTNNAEGKKSKVKTGKGNTDEKIEENHIAFRRVEVGVGATENGYTAIVLPQNFDPKSKIVFKGAYDLLSKMNNAEEEEGH
jgi:cobalt-zinc-cadmium efflux system membrane fusion protein